MSAPTMEDRRMFAKLFGVLPNSSPMDQRALMSLRDHRLSDAAPPQHPDLHGHAADAVRDICARVLGKVVSFSDSDRIATFIIAAMDKANEEFWSGNIREERS